MLLVATEDELSEAVAEKIAHEVIGRDLVMKKIRKSGFGYLRSNIAKFRDASQTFPVFMLTDLDQAACAPRLISTWTGNAALPGSFKLRVAVRESESWLLADRQAVSGLLNISAAKIDRDPENIVDPKQYLLSLATRAPRELRNDILPARGSNSTVGFGYSTRMTNFVRQSWSPRRASQSSPTLNRTLQRVAELAALV
jgi:hypothetical protein